jgi:hypothetical protein
MVVLHLCFGLFTPYNYMTAKWDIMAGKPTLLIFGEPEMSETEAYQIAPAFGFAYKRVAGCDVTTSLVNGVAAYNSVTVAYLNKKLGEHWRTDFSNKTDSLFRENSVDTVRKMVLAMKNFKEMDHTLDSISKGKRRLSVWVMPHKEEANVTVGEKRTDGVIIVYEYFHADFHSLEITSVKF